MPVNGRRPYSEMAEVIQKELVREAASGEGPKYQGLINQVYLNELRAVLPERYIKKTGYVTALADYSTGTVTVGSGTALIQGASTSWTSAHDDFLIKVDGFDPTYRLTYSDGTLMTSKDSLTWTGSTASGASYSMFQDRYQLPSDFDYIAKDKPTDPNAVFLYVNNVKIFLDPWSNEEYDRQITSTIGSIHAYTVKYSSGLPYLHVQANPDDLENIGFEYIPALTQLRELTTGTATVTTGTAVTIGTSSTLITGAVDTARTLYFRVDDDGTGSASVWNKVQTVDTGSTLTLVSAYLGTSSGASATYTISEVSEWPARFDDVMMYKAAWIADPDGEQSQKWLSLTTEAIGLELTTESKRKRGHKIKGFPTRER
jgi:hypothetical protein